MRHAHAPFPARLVVVGDRELLAARAARIGLAPRYADYDPVGFAPAGGVVEVWHQPLAAPVTPGQPDPTNAHSVLAHAATTRRDACATGAFAALVTAPVQKSVMMDAGIPFTGHTEFLAERTHTPRVVMMLVGGAREAPLRVALVTTHLPLADVPAAITPRRGARDARHRGRASFARTFGIAAPRIAVCGLNPHAGEGGHLGREEIDVIAPAIARARARRPHDVAGPLPADTVFVPEHRAPLRRDRRDVPRPGPAGAQGRELRPRRQRDARPAVHPHVGRPRHRARPRGRRRSARATADPGSLVAARRARDRRWRSATPHCA